MKYYIILSFLLVTFRGVSQGIDESPAGEMIGHAHPTGAWMASYSFMKDSYSGKLSGTQKAGDDEVFRLDYGMSPLKMTMDMHMLMVMYGISPKFSLMMMTAYTNMTMTMKSYSANHVHDGAILSAPELQHVHQTSGMSDIKVWALYKLHNGEGSSLVLSGGLSIPAGSYRVLAGEHAVFPGQRETYMMQPGSGSWDFMPGVTYLKKDGRWTWSVQALGNLRPFNNPSGYHLGNEVVFNAWASYGFFSFLSASLRAEGILSEAITGSDPFMDVLSEPAANPMNYGGEKAKGFAGINYYINKSFLKDSKFGIEFGLPFYQNLNGIQLSSNYTLNAGLTKSF